MFTKDRALWSAATLLIASGLTVSGVENPWLGYSLAGVGVVPLALLAWPWLSRRVRIQSPLRFVRIRPDAQPHQFQPETQPQIAPPSQPQPQDDRITVEITPQELLDLYKSAEIDTDPQRLVAPFIGKWIRASVVIKDIRTPDTAEEIMVFPEPVSTDPHVSDAIGFLVFGAEWRDKVIVKRKGDDIIVLGQIRGFFLGGLDLIHCELLADGDD